MFGGRLYVCHFTERISLSKLPCDITAFHVFATLEKPVYLSMPKFLAGCHYNEEEISRYVKKYIGYWPVQINDNKFATGQILEKLVEVVKGWI